MFVTIILLSQFLTISATDYSDTSALFPQKLAAATSILGKDICDSRKCISNILDDESILIADKDESFCWANLTNTSLDELIGNSFPSWCAEGYEGHPIEDPITGSYVNQTVEGTIFIYYACCPNNEEPPTCSDSFCASPRNKDCLEEDFSELIICEGDEGYPYPRRTNFNVKFDDLSDYRLRHFTCCNKDDGSGKYRFYDNDSFRILISALAVICALALCVGILRNQNTRGKAQNIYLVGLMIPDLLVDLSQLLETICGLSGIPYPRVLEMPVFEFYFHANIWLNLIIAYRMFEILKATKQCRRIIAPKVKSVMKEIGIIYTITISWGIVRGIEAARLLNLFGMDEYLIYFTIGSAFIYLSYISFRVHCEKLLQLNNHKRVMAIFFFRVIASFWCVWVPVLILYLIDELSKNPSTQIRYFIIYLVSFQAIATFSVAMTKQDVRKAVLPCASENTELANDDENPPISLEYRTLRSKSSSYLRASSMQSSNNRRSSLNFMSRSDHGPSSSDWRSLKASGVKTIKKKSERMSAEEPLQEEELKTVSTISPSVPQDSIIEDQLLGNVSISPSSPEEHMIEDESHEDDEEKDRNKIDVEDNEPSRIETMDV
ncbi:hypothetical protein CTEN210_17761 [Chaetoceros tenuissimus]|uniref:Intimal thickness related receptor IRP domain-containing protein n=1 Tax=Chaetoceros tenuissimus TaxID=426638 RepID=A0AAD3DE31_9STRA|nr:hypothetical protein CTEN210_17761 [Chaetoceros tenuissimus]